MIRVMLALAWREVRLTIYRAAALTALAQRQPHRPTDPGRDLGQPALWGHRYDVEQRAEIAADAETMAWAMLNAERNTEHGGEP